MSKFMIGQELRLIEHDSYVLMFLEEVTGGYTSIKFRGEVYREMPRNSEIFREFIEHLEYIGILDGEKITYEKGMIFEVTNIDSEKGTVELKIGDIQIEYYESGIKVEGHGEVLQEDNILVRIVN